MHHRIAPRAQREITEQNQGILTLSPRAPRYTSPVQSHTSEGWIARGDVRALNVFGERGYVFLSAGSWRWVDPERQILWEIAREGIIRGTSLRGFSVRELVIARGEETVSGARFLGGPSPAVVMTLDRFSAGFSRVALAPLDGSAPTVLLAAASGTSDFELSLDEQLVFAWNSTVDQGRIAVYSARGSLIDRVDAPWVHSVDREAWVPVDRDAVWTLGDQGLEAHPWSDPSARTTVCSIPLGSIRWLHSPIGRPLLVVQTGDDRAGQRYVIDQRGAARDIDEREARALASTAYDHVDPSTMREDGADRRIASMALAPDGSALVSIDAARRVVVQRTRDGATQLEVALDERRHGGAWIARLCEGGSSVAVVDRDEWDREIALVRLDAREAARDVRFVLPSEAIVLAISEDASRALIERASAGEALGRWSLCSAREGEPRERALRFEPPNFSYARLDDERSEIEVCGEAAHLRVCYEREPPVVEPLRTTADHAIAVGAAMSAWTNEARSRLALVSDRGPIEVRDGSLFRRSIHSCVVANRSPRAAVTLEGSPCVIVYDSAGAAVAELTSERPTTDRVRVIALSDDGRVLAVALSSGRVVMVELGAQ